MKIGPLRGGFHRYLAVGDLRPLSCGNQSYRCHGRFCYYLLIYLFIYHLLLLLSITYICFAISYSPLKSHKKTYSHFVVLLLCVRFVHLVASHHLCSSAVLLFNFYPHPSYVIVCLLKKKKQRGLCCGLCNYKFHICVADCGALTAAFVHHLNGYATLLQYHSLP